MLHFNKQFQAETWTCIELDGIFDAVELLLIPGCRSDAAAVWSGFTLFATNQAASRHIKKCQIDLFEF